VKKRKQIENRSFETISYPALIFPKHFYLTTDASGSLSASTLQKSKHSRTRFSLTRTLAKEGRCMLNFPMSFFCVFWTPLVLFFWNSLNMREHKSSGGLLAFVLGTLLSVFHYLFYPLVKASGFGLFLWFHTLIDIVSVPAVLPLLVFALLTFLRLPGVGADPAKFVLTALIPAGILRAIGWGGQNAPLYLVLVPLIWTMLVLSVSFFVRLVFRNFPLWLITLLSVIVLAPAAATVFWAFYGQMPFTGFLLLAPLSILSLIALITTGLARREINRKQETANNTE
jgi:hypothetical protein